MVIDWPHWECLNQRPRARVAHQIWLFVLKPLHGGIFTWRAQIPVILAWKGERKGYIQGNHPRTIKGCNNRYFQGTKLQVIFGLRPLVGVNTTIVSIYIAALSLHREWAIKVKCVFEFKRRNLESKACCCCVEDVLDEHQPGVLLAWIFDKWFIPQVTEL